MSYEAGKTIGFYNNLCGLKENMVVIRTSQQMPAWLGKGTEELPNPQPPPSSKYVSHTSSQNFEANLRRQESVMN